MVQINAGGGTTTTNSIPWQIQLAVVVPPGGAAPFVQGAGGPGSVLVFDQGTASEETVVVQAPPPGWTPPPNPNPAGGASTYWIWATFQKEHGVYRNAQAVPPVQLNGGASIWLPGNPGPQTTFNIAGAGYPGVVPAYTVLK